MGTEFLCVSPDLMRMHHGGLEEGIWGVLERGGNMYLISPHMHPDVAPRRAERWIVQTQWLEDEGKVIDELREERMWRKIT